MLNIRIVLGILTAFLLAITYLFVPRIFHGDANSAEYLLNTIAATLSTIFALSLSMMMVAIQLSAGKYSSRIFDYFLSFPLNVPLIMIFLTAILHSTYILGQVRNEASTIASLALPISFDIVMMAFGFAILLLYMFRVMNILKPDKLVSKLKTDIQTSLRKNNVREAMYHIEQLSDVAKKTTVDMDSLTAVLCIRAIAATVEVNTFSHEKQKHWYIEQVIATLHGLALVAFNSKEHGVADVVIHEMTSIANFAIKEKDFQLAEHIVETVSVIVSSSLIGRKQLMTVQKIILHLENIVTQVVSIAKEDSGARSLIIKIFKTINFLGKQIIESEALGVTFVAKYMITGGLGAALAAVADKRCDKLVPDIFYEYTDLVVRVIRKGEIKNIITMTTWMRKQILEKDADRGKVFILLKTYLVMAGVAVYLKNFENASIIIKALGKYFPPDAELLQELKSEDLDLRFLFDYSRPDKYLQEAFHIWSIFHKASSTKDEMVVNLSVDEVLQNRDKWDNLFDGLPVEEFVNGDEMPEEIEEEFITTQDLSEEHT